MTVPTLKPNRRHLKFFYSDLFDLAESYESLFCFTKHSEIQEIYPVLIAELNERLNLLHKRALMLQADCDFHAKP